MPKGKYRRTKAKKEVAQEPQVQQIQAPTIEQTGSFSDFMRQMTEFQSTQANISQETMVSQDSRSQVLQALATTLNAHSQLMAEAVMHLATIANTAPAIKDTQEVKVYPVE